MKIVLTYDEVKQALLDAAMEKVSNVTAAPEVDYCYFDITAAGKDVEDLETVDFVVPVE